MIFSGIQGAHIFKKFSLFPSGDIGGMDIRLELSENSPVGITKKAV